MRSGMDRACVWLGLYPSSYTTYSGPDRIFYWKSPGIRIVAFDCVKRKITFKVDPPEGSFVAAMPMLDCFHLIGTSDFGEGGGSEFEIPLVGGYDGFSEYKTGNGLFTLSYGETDARFIYLRIGWPKE